MTKALWWTEQYLVLALAGNVRVDFPCALAVREALPLAKVHGVVGSVVRRLCAHNALDNRALGQKFALHLPVNVDLLQLVTESTKKKMSNEKKTIIVFHF